MTTITIGQLANLAGVSIQTVYYYERRGLMPFPSRTASGYRAYSHEDVKRLRFISGAKELGFTLQEILELLSLKVDPDTTCQDVKDMTNIKIKHVEKKIEDLKQIERALVKLSKACSGEGPTGECPILEALEGK